MDTDKKAADDAAAAARKATEQFTAEEETAFKEFEKEFPDGRKALAAVERVVTTRLTNEFRKELDTIKQQFQHQLAPVSATLATNAFDAVVLRAHKDAYEVLPKIEEWVTTKPAIMQAAFNRVLDGGYKGADKDTIELIDLYKSETVQPAAPPPPTPEQDPEKKKKLESMEGVKGRQSSKSSTAVDPDDFDGAFDKFAAA